MLKTFSVVLLTLAMSAGFADARDRNTIPGCAVGERATAKCVCGMRAFRPLLCHPGQWCHPPRLVHGVNSAAVTRRN